MSELDSKIRSLTLDCENFTFVLETEIGQIKGISGEDLSFLKEKIEIALSFLTRKNTEKGQNDLFEESLQQDKKETQEEDDLFVGVKAIQSGFVQSQKTNY